MRARAQLLEQFLAQQYRGTKRFGLEGCEALIVALNSMIERAGLLGPSPQVLPRQLVGLSAQGVQLLPQRGARCKDPAAAAAEC